MFKKRILLFALALAGAIAALQLTRGTANEAPIKPPPYEPATRDKDGLIAAAGLIEAAAENTLLGSPTSGTVAKVHVKVWDKVKAGDPILTLDERDLRAQHAVQKAAVSAAEATAGGTPDIERAQAITRRLVDRAITSIGMAGAGIEVLALASVRATREATVKQDGHLLPVVVGTPMAGETIGSERFDGLRKTAVFPGDLPQNIEPLFRTTPLAAEVRDGSFPTLDQCFGVKR